jgi:glycosyltransferase involved in cell wall biosynthesis
MKAKHIAFTICTKSYLAGALEWRRTLVSAGTGIRGLIYVVDAQVEELLNLCIEVASISIEHADGLENDLRCATVKDIPDDKGMRERYKTIEYCTAIKPSLFLSLAEQFPRCVLHYFDPDIAIYNELAVLRQFSEEHSITLIPHMTTPTDDEFRLTQLHILRAGVFNFGYIGWNPTFKSGLPLIQWWQGRLRKDCRIALEEGIFTDQSWGVFFCSSPEAGILYDQSYNVAYWNLHERCISRNSSAEYLVNNRGLNFFHFSGYSPTENEQISMHQNRHSFINNKELKVLFDEYASNLFKAGFVYWRDSHGTAKIANNTSNRKKEISELVESKVRSKIPDPFKKPYKNLLMAAILSFNYKAKFEYKRKVSKLTKKARELPPSKIIKKQPIKGKNSVFKFFLKRVRVATDNLCKKKSEEENCSYFGLWLYWLSSFIKQLFVQLNQIQKKDLITTKDNTSYDSSIALIGYITAETGVGESARGIVRAIESGEGKLDIFDIRGHYARAEDSEYASKVSLKIGKNKNYKTCILCVNADQVEVTIKSEPGNIHGLSDRKIAYWYWETEKLPLNYVHASKHFDQIWVATSFVKKAFIDSGIRCPVNVIPPALSALPERYYDGTHFNLDNYGGRPILLSVFDATSFLGRKNPIAAIRTVQGLQTKTSIRPLLVLKTTNLEPKDEIYLKSICPDVEILILNRYLTKNETLSLIKISNCFISLHRAEGLGLSLIDAMRIGTPLLATDYSGPIDFASQENAWMVPWKYTNATIEDGPYFGSPWADPIEEKATDMLIEILSNVELRNKKSDKAKVDIEEHFSKQKISKLIDDALKSSLSS